MSKKRLKSIKTPMIYKSNVAPDFVSKSAKRPITLSTRLSLLKQRSRYPPLSPWGGFVGVEGGGGEDSAPMSLLLTLDR